MWLGMLKSRRVRSGRLTGYLKSWRFAQSECSTRFDPEAEPFRGVLFAFGVDAAGWSAMSIACEMENGVQRRNRFYCIVLSATIGESAEELGVESVLERHTLRILGPGSTVGNH
jgi:hypothetical protein